MDPSWNLNNPCRTIVKPSWNLNNHCKSIMELLWTPHATSITNTDSSWNPLWNFNDHHIPLAELSLNINNPCKNYQRNLNNHHIPLVEPSQTTMQNPHLAEPCKTITDPCKRMGWYKSYQHEFISITCLSTGAARDPGHGTRIARGVPLPVYTNI